MAPFGDDKRTPEGDDEDDAFAAMSEARGAQKKGDFAKAIAKLTEAIQKVPSNPVFYATRCASPLPFSSPRSTSNSWVDLSGPCFVSSPPPAPRSSST